MQAARVVYRSTSGDDMSPTIVSGSVFVPKGDAPDGGWPVVSLGHATLGIDTPCAPSLDSGLLGFLRYVNVFTGMGYAVALADFQGLGAKGIHPYSDSRTAGLNMIDAVRALRHTFPDVSDRWVAFGDSQGAGASWAADEQAKDYAPELKLLGALAASPPADMTGIVQKAQDGTLTSEQRGVIQAIIESLARLHPDLNRDDFRAAGAKHYWNVAHRLQARQRLRPQPGRRRCRATGLRPEDPWRPPTACGGSWRTGRCRRNRCRNRCTSTTAARTRSSTRSGRRRRSSGPAHWAGASPSSTTRTAGTIRATRLDAIQWMTDRFEGKPAKNDC